MGALRKLKQLVEIELDSTAEQSKTKKLNNLYYFYDEKYPDSDGKPMADNTKQFNWIVTIKEGLNIQYQDDKNVFVAGDLLWYTKQGDPKARIAPDAMVVFGRPKEDRGSYKQWQEDNIAPQVVFEVWSPGNRMKERIAKKNQYEELGVDEFYEYDPDRIKLKGWIRKEGKLEEVKNMNGWMSPKLGIRFEIKEELELYHPDGSKFETFLETANKVEETRKEKEQAQLLMLNERKEKEQAQLLMFNERKEKEQAQQRAELSEQKAEMLAKKLKELGIDL